MMVIAAVVVTGCADMRGEQALREIWAEEKDEAKLDEYKAVPDQVLASGDVLSVRVSCGESGAKQCQVRIDNERNDWYDEVEVTAAFGLAAGKGYDDYPFGAAIFNKQITNEINNPKYTLEAVNGVYKVTVTADTGYSVTVNVRWDGEQFSPNLLFFSLD